MKKIIALVLAGVLLILLGSVHILGFSYNKFEERDQKHILSMYEQYNSRIYTAKEDMENNDLKSLAPLIDEFFELLPDEKTKEFDDEGWKIIIASKKPTYVKELETIANFNIGGNAEHNKRLIFIYLNNGMGEYLLSDFIHEFGHYDDWQNGLVSKTNGFVNIFKNNKKYVPEDAFDDVTYHLKSSQEFFACCYKDYFLHGDKLKNEAPEVYNYIDDVVKNGNSEIKAFYMRVFYVNKEVE